MGCSASQQNVPVLAVTADDSFWNPAQLLWHSRGRAQLKNKPSVQKKWAGGVLCQEKTVIPWSLCFLGIQ